MTGKVMELRDVLSPDMLATRITERYVQWESLRRPKKNDWEEIRRYIYATDTSQTTNAKNPWKNRTVIPKLCQTRDNLIANYMATSWPRRKDIYWEANDKDSNQVAKKDAITNMANWWIEQPEFKHEMDKIMMDYVDYGNCFGTVEWVDRRAEMPDKTQAGYVGPMVRRICPLDIVFNPTAENFISTPKIVRTILSLGEVRELLQRLSNDENRVELENLYQYLKEIRYHARSFQGDWIQKDHFYAMDGFSSFRAYLLQDFVEVLTFYGDWYDDYNDHFEKNRVITVIDRHRLINNRPNASFFGYPPIFHVSWRKKQDNLWGMGPFDNLIGMQYRMDHIENMKADIFDLVTYPVQKITGFVEDYVWQPGEKIFVGDEGDVELVNPEVQPLNSNMEIANLANLIEEMAGAPKEAMGFRSPGEKTAYEVQRLENAASRIFQHRIAQFEEHMTEPLLNAMLELAKRNMVESTTIRVMDDEFNLATFQELTVEDITGVGRLRPVAARHFAEQAQLIQNLTNLTSTGVWQTVQPHFSSVKMAKVVEDALNLKELELVTPYISIAEQAEAQMQSNMMQQVMQRQLSTPTGLGNDYDQDLGASRGQPGAQGTPFNLQKQPPPNATPGGLLATQ